ncbi:MAG: helix-turn-helix domain-containing protein [Chloroflexota bacterium]
MESELSGFAVALKEYRETAGLSQRALARAANVDAAVISRMEAGDRGPSGAAQVLALADALNLSQGATDDLLSSAGFWPEIYLKVGPRDETLMTVANLLASTSVGAHDRDRFRRVIALLVEQWTFGGQQTEAQA